jgi:hypothetical protein
MELPGFRIDTLAFDKESSAFIIIEYKKDRNFSVVDQGVAYLNLMLNNKGSDPTGIDIYGSGYLVSLSLDNPYSSYFYSINSDVAIA